ncbi:SWPV2-ORF053 [Shearwaterpox virus]|uniref:SWPV2-ORF053 n=1 Tax=Shearwaterpox virus TaxID=1974596 RepID=A0A1V0QG11_CNPV|nr:SWPV2-ORF053 [Shearwaterpox virus]QRM15687.1 putative serpin [Penguinpox virus 2]QRM16017.1 putative serpin [Albatrosspox virus]
MDYQIDIVLKIYNANKFKPRVNKSICFSPKSVCSVLYMLLSSTDENHLPFLKSVLSNIGNSYSCLSDMSLVTGRTSYINNYMVTKSDLSPCLKGIDITFVPYGSEIVPILEYNEINKEDNLCSSINDKVSLVNECFMIQPLPYNRTDNCVINYYWYKIIEDHGLTILNFYPSYQTVRIIMIICDNKDINFYDIDKEKLINWTSYDSMKRSTLPFKLPVIKVESSLDITESFPEIFSNMDSEKDEGVCSNSIFEISSEKIVFATISHNYVGNHNDNSHSHNENIRNPFIVIIEDTYTKQWLFFGMIR